MTANNNYTRTIPDAPLPVSMLPRANEVSSQDLLLLIKPNNDPGDKTKALELETLANSDILRFSNVLGGTFTNILTYTGPLPWSNNGSNLCQVETDPRNQVIFFVDGTSESAGQAQVVSGQALKSFQYGLKGMVRSYFPFDDQNYSRNDQYISAGSKDFINNPSIPESYILVHDEFRVCYKGAFMEDPTPLPNVDWASKPAEMRTKTVGLWIAGGVTDNPYKLTPPASYTLKIQALIFKARYAAASLESV